MTDQELQEMLAELIAAQKETDRILKASAERAEEERRKTEEERRKTEEERRKTEEERRKRAEELAEERRKRAEELAEEQRKRAEELAEEQRKWAEELAEEQRKWAEELAEERRKTEEAQRRIAEELAEERRKTEEERRKTEEAQRRIAEELAEERRKTEAERRKTEREIREVNKQLGALGNKFGSFAEGMALPSMEKILYRRFNMDVVAPRAKARQNGETLEIDVMAYDNGSRNEVYLVEVKSHLTREGIEQMLKTIERFPKFFGAHRDRTIYGVIAAVDIPDNLRAEVLKRGLYLARIHDDTFELLTPRGFKPAAFGPAAGQNGKAQKRPSRKK